MNIYNQHILNFLHLYLGNDNPGYAVMLKGQWGSGKSHFVQEFIKKITDGIKAEEDVIVWKPLYVPLYGVKEIPEINNQLNKQIHPLLNSKGATVFKNIVKGLASAAIKYNVDNITGGGEKEEITCKLDLLDALDGIKGDDVKLKGKKLIIFDDFERCQVDKQLLLGYINSFVEHRACHVIVVSAEQNMEDPEIAKIQPIKEKTIGMEFDVQPEAKEAVIHFIKDIKTQENRLQENIPNIINLFEVSGIKNLRILQQALYDYSQCVKTIDPQRVNQQTYPVVVDKLLLSFVACYLEYKTGNTVVADLGTAIRKAYDLKQEGKIDKDTDFLNKYTVFIQSTGLSVFEPTTVNPIIGFLKTGWFDASELNAILKTETNHPLEDLERYVQLPNDIYEHQLNEVKRKVNEEKYIAPRDIIDAVLLLLMLKKEMGEDIDVETLLPHFKVMLDNCTKQVRTLQEFYIVRNIINYRLQYYQNYYIEYKDKITEIISSEMKGCMDRCKDPLVDMLENISAENLDQIEKTLQSTMPDQSRGYNISSIFAGINPYSFTEHYKMLDNPQRNLFRKMLSTHYLSFLNTTNADEFVHYFVDDIEPLRQISELLQKLSKKEIMVKKYNSSALSADLAQYAERIEEIENFRQQNQK